MTRTERKRRVAKKISLKYPTEAESRLARERGEREHRFDGRRLRYFSEQDLIEVTLVNGVHVLTPRGNVAELANLSLTQLKEMKLGAQGAAIEIRSIDLDISVAGLMRDLVGANSGSRRGGLAKSNAKVKAARENGKRGGRPRTRGLVTA